MRLLNSTILAALLAVTTSPAMPASSTSQDVLFQYSTLSALQARVLDGELTAKEFKSHGNFGIGTFDGLDGEMILLKDKIYQVRTDGAADAVEDGTHIPFALCTFIDSDIAFDTENTDLTDLLKSIEDKLPSKNSFYAVRIEGTFDKVKTRSVPGQKPPYPSLEDVIKNQVTLDRTDVKGTIVGFWAPSWASALDAVGYHMHFVSDDLKVGGHLMDGHLRKGTVTIDDTPSLWLELPQNSDFRNASLGTNSVIKGESVGGKK